MRILGLNQMREMYHRKAHVLLESRNTVGLVSEKFGDVKILYGICSLTKLDKLEEKTTKPKKLNSLLKKF